MRSWATFALLVLTVSLGAAADPTDPTIVVIEPDSEWFMITHMHGLDKNFPRLFQRTADLEVESVLAYQKLYMKANDTATLDAFLAGDIGAVESDGKIRQAMGEIRRDYTEHWREASFTDRDLRDLKNFLVGDDKLIITPWQAPTPGFAYVGLDPSSFQLGHKVYQVVIGHSPIGFGGYCDRSVLLHEMTHYCQNRFPPKDQMGYSAMFSVEDDSLECAELAAMIVECAEKVRQGWTGSDFDRLARSGYIDDPYCKLWGDEPFSTGNHNNIIPRLEGDLFVQYLKQYGPQFTGNTAKDLIVLKNWVQRFEGVGRQNYRALSGKIPWQLVARLQVAAGPVDKLASTAQTWLGINGAPSAFPYPPGPNGIIENRKYDDEQKIPLDVLIKKIHNMPGAKPEAVKAAEDFLKRTLK